MRRNILEGVVVGLVLLPLMMGLIIGLLLTLGLAWLLLNLVANSRNRFYESWLAEKVFLMKRSLMAFFPSTKRPIWTNTHALDEGAADE